MDELWGRNSVAEGTENWRLILEAARALTVTGQTLLPGAAQAVTHTLLGAGRGDGMAYGRRGNAAALQPVRRPSPTYFGHTMEPARCHGRRVRRPVRAQTYWPGRQNHRW
jgi:hypothetical protein